MTDDTRERARQVAHSMCNGALCRTWSASKQHSEYCGLATDALVAFADAENEACERLARDVRCDDVAWTGCRDAVAGLIAARRKGRK